MSRRGSDVLLLSVLVLQNTVSVSTFKDWYFGVEKVTDFDARVLNTNSHDHKVVLQ